MSLENLKEQIESGYPRTIRLQGVKKKRKETLQEFLIKFFTRWNPEGVKADPEKRKDTIFTDNKEVQTEAGKRRSLGDIYMICKYYYPDMTLEELLHELYISLPNHFEQGYRTSYCNTIKKRVWYFDETRKNLFYDKTTHDEYKNPYRYYVSLFVDDEEEYCDECGELLDDCECGGDEDWED